ncbi:Uncharacterized protein DAT39_001371, partial [Clarias magur]
SLLLQADTAWLIVNDAGTPSAYDIFPVPIFLCPFLFLLCLIRARGLLSA